MSHTPAPPNPDDLNSGTASDLAEEIERVYEYLARIAHGAATIAEQCADQADREGIYEADQISSVDDYAERASLAATRAERAATAAADTGVMLAVAEDIEPAAVAEVACHLAEQITAALQALAPTPSN